MGPVMNVINFSEARSRLKSVLDQVVENADYTVISRRDAQDAVVMSLDQFNRLMETVHLLKRPSNSSHLNKSIGQYRSDQLTQHGLLDE
jgi:antitoxin YefM